MKTELSRIIGEKAPQRPTEYHVIVSHHSHSVHYSGNINFSMLANDVTQVRVATEQLYPPSQYTIVQIKPIR